MDIIIENTPPKIPIIIEINPRFLSAVSAVFIPQ